MDEFDRRLKRDADAIEAKVSPELRARIDASLHSAGQAAPMHGARRRIASGFWWASSLTGLAAAIAVIAFLNWTRTPPVPVDGVADARPRTVPEYVDELGARFPLDATTAEFAGPLEEELARLRSDLEKARRSVREDIDFAF